MNKYLKYLQFLILGLIIIGMAINVNTEISFWKQFIGYLIIASILPVSMFFNEINAEKDKG